MRLLVIKSGGVTTSVAVSLLLAGCAVGPTFKSPAPPDVHDFTGHPLPAVLSGSDAPGGQVQRFTNGAEISGEWWTLFNSKPLNALIEQALANNPDLKAANAALRVAHESVLAQRGAMFPSVSAGLSATHQRQSQALAPTPNTNAFEYSLYTPQVSVSYVPDVFGLNRRTTESLEAQEQAAHYQAIAAYTALTANVVVTAVQQASVDEQVRATRALIDVESRTVQISQYQQVKGYSSGLDVAAQRSQLAQAAATLPPLLKQSGQLHDQLAVLIGGFPSRTPAGALTLSDLQLPQDLPLSLPSALVRQRPDVLQAEANLHAASAQIGVAIANRLPNIELTATAGSAALAIDQVFTSGTGFWGVGAGLTAPIFQGGALLHRERAARAAYDQAAQQYRSTVLTAFQNVADTLTALEQDAEGLRAAAAAADAAKVTLDGAQRQLQDGYIGYPALLAAEQAYQQTQISLVQAEANRFADTAALFQALGGGWWRHPSLSETDHDK